MADPRDDEPTGLEAALLRLPRPVLPGVAILAIVALGFLRGPGASVLGLAGLALIGAIAVLWSSLRTLFGDAPVSLDTALALSSSALDDDERKRTVLRALKDLEAEHALGKIDDQDFRELRARYRGEAKRILQDIDARMEPARKRAEELVAADLASGGKKRKKKKAAPIETGAIDAQKTEAPADAEKVDTDVVCPSCSTKNDADAAFCKKCGERVRPAVEA